MSNHSEYEMRRRLLRRFIPVVRDLRHWFNGEPLRPIRKMGKQAIHVSENTSAVASLLAPPPLPPAIIPPSDHSSELAGIASRCNVKANGCTWQSDRMRLLNSGADFRTEIAPNDEAIVKQGRQHDVMLWMNHMNAPNPEDPAEYDTLAGCFQCLAASADLMSLVESSASARSNHLQVTMPLMAEAQSMLRTCVQNIGGPSDSEQSAAFLWLRQRAEETGFYIERYMRVADQADPKQWHHLLSRLSECELQVQDVINAEKIQRKLLSKLKYKLKQLEQSNDKQDQLTGIDCTVNDLVNNGLPPSNVELRELMLPHLETISEAENKSTGLTLTLREIARFTAATNQSRDYLQPKRPSKEVTEVAKLLRGRSVAMIGGGCRPETKQSIQEAFGLAELVWIDTDAHPSYQTFKPVVERPDVAVVLLAIRWASHSYGEVGRYCKDNGTPLVRLPGGYNANQIATQILAQCSEQLVAQGQVEESTQ